VQNLAEQLIIHLTDAEKLVELWGKDAKIYFAIDSTLISSYLNMPYEAKFKNQNALNILFFNYSAISFIFEYVTEKFNKPLILLPPYEIEYKDVIAFQKYNIREHLKKLHADEYFSDSINSILNNKTISEIIKKYNESNIIDNSDTVYVIQTLYEKFSEIFFSLFFDEESVNRQFSILNTKLVEIPKEMPLPNISDVVNYAESIFEEFNRVKKDVSKRFANYVDASSLSYLFKINEEMNKKNTFVILISNAPFMFKVLEQCKNKGIVDTYPIIHPNALLMFVLNLDTDDLEQTSININDTKKRIEALINELKADVPIETFLSQILKRDINDNTVSALRLQELQYFINNNLSPFKEGFNKRLYNLCRVVYSNPDSWEKYKKELKLKYSRYEKLIKENLSNLNKIKNLKALIYGSYLFDYENREIIELLDDITIYRTIEDVFQKLNTLKANNVVEAFHVSAYIYGKLEKFELAEKDIEEGITRASKENKKEKERLLRLFNYLKNINLANRGKLEEAIQESITYANRYGEEYPRFWLNSGYLYWNKWLRNKEEVEYLNKAIEYNKKAIGYSLKNKNKYCKCLLLAYANLIRYNVDKDNYEEAENYWNLLNTTYTECKIIEKLPLFSFIKCYLWIKKMQKANTEERKKLCYQIIEEIGECKQNFLIVNKLTRDEYSQLFVDYENYCDEKM